MKINIKKKEFENSLNNISKALNSNSPLQSLQGVLIKASGNTITMIASNGNLSIKEETEGNWFEIIKSGTILVSGRLFREIIKKHSTDITITETEDSILVSSDGLKTKLNTLNNDDYPIISFESIGKDLIVGVGKLNSIIKNVSFAAADQDKRLILNGVNLSSSNGKLTAAATNSFRLSKEVVETSNEVDFDITILSKNLKDFVPAGAKGDIKISVNDSKIITQHETTTVVSSLIDGVYPEVARLIPETFAHTLKMDVKTILNMLDKVSVVNNDNNKVSRLSVNGSELKLESKRDEVGDSVTQTTDFEWESSDERFDIVFNSEYFKQAVTKFTGGVEIKFNSPLQPIMIVGASNKNMTQLVLPHRTY